MIIVLIDITCSVAALNLTIGGVGKGNLIVVGVDSGNISVAGVNIGAGIQ